MSFKFLRRMSVRARIVGGFAILLLLLALSVPLIVYNQFALTSRVQQLTNVEAKSDRLLLLTLSRILSSRVNLTRYADDLVPSPSDALADITQAYDYVQEANLLVTSPEQKTATALILSDLVQYKTLVGEVQTARGQDRTQDVTTMIFNANRLEASIEEQIRAVVSDSEIRVTSASTTTLAEAQQRLYLLVGGFILIFAVSLAIAAVIQRSITKPIAELREGVQAFRLDRKATHISSVGTDELSVLAQTFNQITSELALSYSTLEQQVIERTAALARRSTQLETASQVSRETASVLDLQQLLNQTATLISERFGFYHVGVFMLDENKEWAVLQAASSEGGKKMLARAHRLKIGETGIVGYVTKHGEARIALNVGEDAVFFNNPDLPNTRSEVALPLRARDEVIGALDVQHIQENAFSSEDVSVLQTLADQIALAISNARLYQQAQTSLEQLRRVYGEFSRQAWEQITRQKSIPMYRYVHGEILPEENVLAPEMRQAIAEDTPITKEPSTNKGSEASITIPIKSLGQTVGVLNVSRKNADRNWSEDEIALIGTITNQLGVALESARLFSDTQHRAENEKIVSSVTAQMRQSLDVDTVLQTAVREMRRIMNLADIDIQLGVEQTTQLTPTQG